MPVPTSVYAESKTPSPRPAASGVALQANINGFSALAQENRAVALGLAKRGMAVHLAPQQAFDPADPTLCEEGAELQNLAHRPVDLAESVLYYGSIPTAWNLDYYGRCRIGRAMFWSDRVPNAWIEPCNSLDEVWVPSNFHREGFAAAGVARKKLRVVPTGVDTDHFRPDIPPLTIPDRRGFNFLAVTDPHDRKGTDILLTAFLREFHANDDVSLTLKVPRLAENADFRLGLAFFIEKQLQLTLEKCANVLLLEDNLEHAAMPALYAAADAFVLPSRGEFCGLPLLEALACELPVITTRWGAPIEYLNDDNSYLIAVGGLTAVPVGDEFLPGHRWANASVDHLRQLMRQVSSNPEQAKARARTGRQQIVQSRGWSALLPLWEQEFCRLLS